MAGCDYLSCEGCGQRLFYDPDPDSDRPKVTCSECVDKLRKTIVRLEKKLKRGK